MSSGDFSIGSRVWPGLSKLLEECGELVQVGGKLIATGGSSKHWDGSDLTQRLEEELADVQAAIEFLISRNSLNRLAIAGRAMTKVTRFHAWHDAQGHEEAPGASTGSPPSAPNSDTPVPEAGGGQAASVITGADLTSTGDAHD